MGISNVSLQFLCAPAPNHCCSGLFASTSSLTAPFKAHTKSKKKRCSLYLKEQFCSKPSVRAFGIRADSSYYGAKNNGSQRLKCPCQRAEGISGITSDDSGNGSWLRDATAANGHVLNEVVGQDSVGHEELHASRKENGGIIPNDDKSVLSGSAKQASHKKKGYSVEDEAWHLLQESVVHYCGNPVGTIAAKDPNDGNTLNYDQVFIRDFIPSGIAFLLKGEYDIVRNFVLNTLQLQVLYLLLL